MIIRKSINHPDGIIADGQVDTYSELNSFETYVHNFFSSNQKILESSSVYVADEGKYYVKNSSGEWKESKKKVRL